MAHPMRVSPRTIVAAAVLVLLAVLQGTAFGAARTVNISGFAFAPATIVIAQGDTITWHNGDPATHTATSNTGAFDTGPVGAGANSTAVPFAVAGTFAYHCSIHPTMTGTITVQAAATPPPTLPPTPAPTAPPTPAPTVPPTPSPSPAPTAPPTPSASPSPSPTATPTPTLAPLPTVATAAPTRPPSDTPVPVGRVADGGGTPLAAAVALVAAALAGLAIYLYRRR